MPHGACFVVSISATEAVSSLTGNGDLLLILSQWTLQVCSPQVPELACLQRLLAPSFPWNPADHSF